MSSKIITHILNKRVLYSTSLLAGSLFLGQAPLSIAFVIWILFNGLILKWDKGWAGRLIFLPVLFGLCGITISLFLYKQPKDLIDLLKYMPFVLIPLGMWRGKDIWKDYQNVRCLYISFIFTAVITLCISIIHGVLRWIDSANSIYITYNHLADLFGVQPIYLSLFYLIAILFSLELYFRETNFRKIYLYLIALLLLGIVLLASRSSFVIAILILIIKFYMIFAKKRQFILVMAAGIVVGASIIVSVPTLRERFVKFDENVASYSGTNFRFRIWENAIEVGKQSPFWGYGYSNSQEVLQEQYEKVNFRRARLGKMNTHNQFLQSFLDNGIIGLTFLVLMIFLPLFIKTQSFTAISFWIIIALALITESFFRRQFGSVFYSLLYSYFIIQSSTIISVEKSQESSH